MSDKEETETMRFKWLAEGCKTWDEIIDRLKHRITLVETLRDQGARILDNQDDYVIYAP